MENAPGSAVNRFGFENAFQCSHLRRAPGIEQVHDRRGRPIRSIDAQEAVPEERKPDGGGPDLGGF